mgnify:CR=1 FL=1
MPQKEDIKLLANTIRNSFLIVNIGSSMVFDAISHNKPCAYINYNTWKNGNAAVHMKAYVSND